MFKVFIQAHFIWNETQFPIILSFGSKRIVCSFLTSSMIILAIFHAISSLACEIKQ